MRKLLVISMVIITLLSCEKYESQRIKLTEDYFPLEIGNQWEFEVEGKKSIVDKTDVNGIEYFQFENDYGTSSYYRKQDDRIYFQSSTGDSKEEMMFDLAANVNDTWTYDVGYVTLTSRSETITIGNFQIDNCLKFSFHNTDLIDYGKFVWLAPGIGVIQKMHLGEFSGGTLQLENATIDKQYIDF